MPVIGPQVSGDIGTLTGNGLALAVGLIGALWTGLGVTLAIGTALDRIWAVPPSQRPGFLSSRLRGLLVLAAVGTVNVLATIGVGLATAGGSETVVTQVLSLAAAAGIDLVLFTASFRVLTAAEVTTRQVLPGAVLASACWLALQALGGVFVTQVLAGSSETYGGFAAVIGLLTWLLIAARADPDRGRAERRARSQALAAVAHGRPARGRQARLARRCARLATRSPAEHRRQIRTQRPPAGPTGRSRATSRR